MSRIARLAPKMERGARWEEGSKSEERRSVVGRMHTARKLHCVLSD